MSASAAVNITVIIDENTVSLNPSPQIINGNVMLPVKAAAEAIDWETRSSNAAVIELAKTVKYTDGSREYLFSSHTVTLNLEREWINRSIMIGVGRFFDTDDDRRISFAVKPEIINGNIFISIKDLPKCLYAAADWNEVTKTISIKSGSIPYYDGQGLPNRDELFEQMRTYHKISGTLTRIGEQSSLFAQSTETSKTTLPFKPSGIMTSAPKTGSVPANILLPDKTDVKSNDSYHTPYKNNIRSGCNWYVYGRLYETTGIWVPNKYQFGTRGGLKDIEAGNPDYIKVERDVNRIVSGCAAIYIGKTTKDTGHAVFVEYVERDASGKPVSVYYTDSNHSRTGYYDPARDAKVIKVSFEKFAESLYVTKVFDGYIIPVK